MLVFFKKVGKSEKTERPEVRESERSEDGKFKNGIKITIEPIEMQKAHQKLSDGLFAILLTDFPTSGLSD